MPLTTFRANSASPRLIISRPMQAKTDGVMLLVAQLTGVTLAAANPLDHIALAVSRAPIAVGSAGGDREFAANIPAMTASVYGPCCRVSMTGSRCHGKRIYTPMARRTLYLAQKQHGGPGISETREA